MNDIQLTRIKEMIANNNTEDAILELKKTLSGPQVGDFFAALGVVTKRKCIAR